MWKNIKTLLLGTALLFIGVIVIPIGATLAVRGLEVHEVNFTLPSEIDMIAQTEAGYSVFQELLNTFRLDAKFKESKYIPDNLDVQVIVEEFDPQEFHFWIKFGYIASGISLGLLFTIAGLVCIYLGFARLMKKETLGIEVQAMKAGQQAKPKKKVKKVAVKKAPKGKKKRKFGFFGMSTRSYRYKQ